MLMIVKADIFVLMEGNMGINENGKWISTLPESKATAWYKIELIDGLGRSAKFFHDYESKFKQVRKGKDGQMI